ncbi:MAG: hypothetical protein IT482_02715 [Gammaproteobacteria bacterium]|nr:hypothetical protein [Gammaproteobacteria bacterium]
MHASPVPRELNSLLLALYECPTDNRGWCTTLDLISSAFGARSAVVQVLVPADGYLRSAWHRRDSESERSRELHESVLPDCENPRLRVASASLGLREAVVRDADLFSRDQASLVDLRSRLAALGLGAFLGGALPLDERRFVTLALHRGLSDRIGFRARDESLLEQLLPHLRRAIGFTLRLESEQRRNLQLSAALDQLSCGVLVCDARGRPTWRNATAANLWSAPGEGEAGSLLGAWLRRASDRFPAREPHWVVQGDLQLLLCPVQGGDETLVFAGRRTGAGLVPEALIARMFGLTPAESVLAAALCAGRSLEQHAAARGVALGTVRCQLKRVLRKTQCAKQSDLVRQVLSSIAAGIRHR